MKIVQGEFLIARTHEINHHLNTNICIIQQKKLLDQLVIVSYVHAGLLIKQLVSSNSEQQLVFFWHIQYCMENTVHNLILPYKVHTIILAHAQFQELMRFQFVSFGSSLSVLMNSTKLIVQQQVYMCIQYICVHAFVCMHVRACMRACVHVCDAHTVQC